MLPISNPLFIHAHSFDIFFNPIISSSVSTFGSSISNLFSSFFAPLIATTITSPASYKALILLSGLAGALHVLGPDHWFPTSVLAWQKGWAPSRTILFATFAYFFHVLLGYFLYLFVEGWVSYLGPKEFFAFALGLMVVMTLVRGIRFQRIQQVIRIGRKGVGGGILAFSLLGPCEVVVPMFAKSKFLGMGYLIPFVAFFMGTWLVGLILVLQGRNLWNRPLWLPQGVRWLVQARAAFPLMAGLVLSVGFFFFR